jgi:hypothetical protein
MNRSTHIPALFTLLFCGAIAACGGSQAPATAAEQPTEAPAASAPPEEAPPADTAQVAASASAEPAASAAPAQPTFDQMSDDQKKEFMKTVVLPHMKEKFVAANKKYDKMNCTTCHGPGAKEGKFKMPNPLLPKLDFSDNLAKQTKKSPEMVKFMQETVVPEMAKLLGVPPFDPATKSGFGCLACHTKK